MPTPSENGRSSRREVDRLLGAARGGSKPSLGLALDACRRYLLLVANKAVGQDLVPKVAPSDLVQETLAAAAEKFEQFHGQTEEDLLRWLTQILSYRIAGAVRQYRRTQKTAVDREVPIEALAENIHRSLVDGDTPSAFVLAAEEEERLTVAMETLEPLERQIVYQRNWEIKTFDEIGQTLGRSESGVRKIWGQAIRKLRRELDGRV